MVIQNLKDFAVQKGIELKPQREIADEARDNITKKYGYTGNKIKQNFDILLYETEKETHRLYRKNEQEYGNQVFRAFTDYLVKTGELSDVKQTGAIFGKYFSAFDKFFLSLSQSRKSRAGKSFEDNHNALFKALGYPFDEQKVINGKPDFLMPSLKHYKRNAMDCIIFTSKRTLRERWRQIVTEGTRGLGFYLATIDESISSAQLKEMLNHRIYIVCPETVRRSHYKDVDNVLSFSKFFVDHLDPAIAKWKRNGVI